MERGPATCVAVAAIEARSVALAGFGLDSLIEIGASTVVLWELADVAQERRQRAMRLIGFAFVGLAVYLAIQSTAVLALGFHPRHSPLGIVWTGATAGVMFALAAGKVKTGAALGNPVLSTEGRITMIDGILATAVLVGLILNALLGLVVGRSSRRVCALVLRHSGGTGGTHPLTTRVWQKCRCGAGCSRPPWS